MSELSTTPGRAADLTGAAAVAALTVTNFALVFVGLLAIAFLGDGDIDQGLVNVWSIWGIAHVSMGQSIQVMAALSAPGKSARGYSFIVVATVLVAGLLIIAFKSSLFGSLSLWWVVAALLAVGSASVAGVLRGRLVRSGQASVALAIVCAENGLRAALLTIGLAIGVSDSLIPFAVVAPFALSIPLLFKLWSRPGAVAIATAPASWGRAMLPMVPALASYGLVPALSVLERLPANVDALAIDAALARGPVQVAVFLAPKLLEYLMDSASTTRRIELSSPAVIAVLVVASLLASLLDGSENFLNRLLVAALVGVSALIGYLVLLDGVDRGGRSFLIAISVATIAVLLFGAGVAVGGDAVGLAPASWAVLGAVAVTAIFDRALVERC